MNHVFAGVKALLVRKNHQVLLLKSSKPDGEGNGWDFPGGRVEAGENLMQALAREVKEETGINVDTSQAQLLSCGIYTGFGAGQSDQVMKSFFVLRGDFPDPTLSSEHSGFQWFNPYNQFPADFGRLPKEVLGAYKTSIGIQVADQRILGFTGYGLVQLIHGHGKGKTTAALGQAIRCAGSGRRVAIIYFDKGGTDHYFERLMLEKIPNIDYWATGRDRIDPITKAFDFSVLHVDKQEAARGLDFAHQALTEGRYDLVILDEINSTVDLGMLPAESVLQKIQEKKKNVEVILTGRNPDPRLLAAAHLVTNVQLERHYFYSGVPAREGLDF